MLRSSSSLVIETRFTRIKVSTNRHLFHVSQIAWLDLLDEYNVSYQLVLRPGIKLASVKLHQPGAFHRTLCRLSYRSLGKELNLAHIWRICNSWAMAALIMSFSIVKCVLAWNNTIKTLIGASIRIKEVQSILCLPNNFYVLQTWVLILVKNS